MAESFSFDVVSNFDQQELVNVIDQIRREIVQRYDLKDSGSTLEIDKESIVVITNSEMTLQAIEQLLLQRAVKRNLSLKIFDFQSSVIISGNRIKQQINLRKGLSQELAKRLSKELRDEIRKITVTIQGDSLRVTGKNKDDLQQAMNLLKSQDIEVPLQFENYR
uniref:Uncharacterized protein n=1 Tax=Paulinella longichromatophora TaxID=1708747 RepID=A0A2H4ZNC3_9EUKA|nr:hypothetical protein PLO_017 [Paulinella longichromatophora]